MILATHFFAPTSSRDLCRPVHTCVRITRDILLQGMMSRVTSRKEAPMKRHAPSESARETRLASLTLCAHAHLSNPDLTIEDAAAANYVSTRTTRRLFSSERTTFPGWLRTVGLARPHHRLVTGDNPITDIAYECGLASARYFSRAFREQHGVSARENGASAGDAVATPRCEALRSEQDRGAKCQTQTRDREQHTRIARVGPENSVPAS